MTMEFTQGFITQGGGGSTSENELLATMPAGAVLTAVDVKGVLATETASGVYPTTGFTTLNLMTGLQYANHGTSPFTVVNVPVISGNWLTFSEGHEMFTGRIQGQNAVTYDLFDYIYLNERWRGNLALANQTDLWWSFGENTALSDTVNYRAFFSYRVRWALFP